MAVVDIDGKAAVSGIGIGNDAQGFECDVSSLKSVESCIASIVKHFGKIHILLNNAATKTSDPRRFFAPFEEYSLETWREVMSVNIDGMFLVAKVVGNQLLSQGEGGAIIQTSSIYGMVGPDPRIYEGSDYLGGTINAPAVYAASKSAVIGLTKWLATYWADKDIRVNCIVQVV